MVKDHYFNNQRIVQILKEAAAALEVKEGNRFRIRAYERAATAVEHATVEVKDLWDEGKLTSLSGIGSNIAQHLSQLFEKGQVSHFKKLKKGLPPAMFKFLEIQGIGSKTAFRLSQKLGISRTAGAVTRLKKAIEQKKIRKIEGFGEKSEQEILENLKRSKKTGLKERMLLPYAWSLAQKVIDFLRSEKTILQIEVLGSLRRKVATVGDIDLAVASKDPIKVIEKLKKYPEVKKILAAGKDTARFVLHSGRQVDLKIVSSESYGALLQHYTGSKEHNIHLRKIARSKNMSLSEYGIKFRGKLKKYRKEEELYRALKMDWIPPELREDGGEIEAATAGKLPNLVKENDIRGDLHLHSNFAIEPGHDLGQASFKETIKKAKELNYQYLGFSEHNPSLSQHSDIQAINLIKKKREMIDKVNCSLGKKLSIKVLNGLEIDIKKSGELAFPDQGMKYLDYAIAAVHSNFNLNKKEMTKRVLRGLSHPRVRFLAHPTTRKLGEREGVELDWEQVFDFCKKKNKFLEISSCPQRLDLPDFLVRQAVKIGVKMVINSDSHALSHLELMPYGVSVARRGWAQKSDIINTLKWPEFKKKIKAR